LIVFSSCIIYLESNLITGVLYIKMGQTQSQLPQNEIELSDKRPSGVLNDLEIEYIRDQGEELVRQANEISQSVYKYPDTHLLYSSKWKIIHRLLMNAVNLEYRPAYIKLAEIYLETGHDNHTALKYALMHYDPDSVKQNALIAQIYYTIAVYQMYFRKRSKPRAKKHVCYYTVGTSDEDILGKATYYLERAIQLGCKSSEALRNLAVIYYITDNTKFQEFIKTHNISLMDAHCIHNRHGCTSGCWRCIYERTKKKINIPCIILNYRTVPYQID